ncbi:MAG: DUF1801 domain-containing protein [Flavobacteriaceae bacterium]|nr:DUF1801 domain-containing protein [Flavobacteriaceae bacterium]
MNPAETYIMQLPDALRAIVLHVKSTIEAVIPEVNMKYKWGIPCFYAGKQPICYVNVPKNKGYVDVAFWNSAHLTKHTELMVSKDRKVVKSLRYSALEAIDDTVLVDVLEEAYALRAKGFYKRD